MQVMGIVYEDEEGKICKYVARHNVFRAEWHKRVAWSAQVLFICCGPDQTGVDAIVGQIERVKGDLNAGVTPETHAAPHHVGDTYCYGYFDPAQNPSHRQPWNDAFYIGVGTISDNDGNYGGRWTDHVRDAENGTRPRHHQIRNWLAANPPRRGVRPRRHAVQCGLVRKLYSFSGANRHQLKFFTEQFLIAHKFGAHNLDNDTNGNCRAEAYFGIPRPKVFDVSIPQHRFCWAKLLSAFIENPESAFIENRDQPRVLLNTLIPGLLSLVAATFVTKLNAALQEIGLKPLQNVQEGRLSQEAIIYGNLNVSGANDCMISYRTQGRPYRIDLRFSTTDPSFMINMRPTGAGVVGRNVFNEYMNNHIFNCQTIQEITIAPGTLHDHYGASPIRNANQWPFYKPMAYNANGHSADWFPIEWPPGNQLGFPAVQITAPNWFTIAGAHANLTLVQALEIILAAFPSPE